MQHQCSEHPDQPTRHPVDRSMDPLRHPQVGTARTIPHLIPDQISEMTMGTRVRTIRTDKTSAETTVETEGKNKLTGLNREIIAFKTGTATTKTEIGFTTEGDQTNTNTTEINPEHR